MLSKKQASLIRKLDARLPKGSDKYYGGEIQKFPALNIQYLPYIDIGNKARTLPVSEEDMNFIMRQSDSPIFYAHTCMSGEKIVLMYDPKISAVAKEIEIEHPCRLQPSKFYYTKDLTPCEGMNPEKSPEKDYTFIWENSAFEK